MTISPNRNAELTSLQKAKSKKQKAKSEKHMMKRMKIIASVES